MLRSGSLIWGFVLVLLGTLFLLANYNALEIDWSVVWRLWPIFLIVIGLGMLQSAPRIFWIVVGLLLVGAGAIVAYGQTHGWHTLTVNTTPIIEKNFSEPIQSDSRLGTFHLDGGAGKFRIINPVSELVNVDTSTANGQYDLTRITENDGREVVTLKQQWHAFKLFGGVKNEATIQLGENVLWDFDIATGAADFSADLTKYQVNDLKINAGATSIDLTLGSLTSHTNVTVKSGASSITIRVPKESNVLITADTGLTNKEFNGFTQHDDTWKSEGYTDGGKQITISFETGVSSLKVERY